VIGWKDKQIWLPENSQFDFLACIAMDDYFDPTTITLTHFFYSMSNFLNQLQIRNGKVSYYIHCQRFLSFMLKHRMQGLQQFSWPFRAYESTNEGKCESIHPQNWASSGVPTITIMANGRTVG
jgi:hypothetical protein